VAPLLPPRRKRKTTLPPLALLLVPLVTLPAMQ
jgi:hypothetical protein